MNKLLPRLCSILFVFTQIAQVSSAIEEVNYDQVAPIFTKYCAGCHNETDREGDFSLTSLEALAKGTPDGAVVVAGQLEQSKLWQLVSGNTEPNMPPKEEPAPTKAELEIIRQWIAGGMRTDERAITLASRLTTPKLTPAATQYHYLGAGCAVGSGFALGKLQRIELFELIAPSGEIKSDPTFGDVRWTVNDLSGKVNSLRASADGQWLIAGSGIAGIGGEVVVIDVSTGAVAKRFEGHADSVYCAALSPNGKWLATGSYDRRVILWDVESGQAKRELTGHNGAIYDLDFDPSGEVLATASADQTVKLWNVQSGERLDTLGQPEGEMLCVRFDPSGNFVFAGGADKQIRKWQLVSRDKPSINPMLIARYAHESAILQIEVLEPGLLLSASDDRTAKLWTTQELTSLGQVALLADTPVAISKIVSTTAASKDDPIGVIIELTGEKHFVHRAEIENLLRVQAERSRAVVSSSNNPQLNWNSLPSEPETTAAEVEINDHFSDAMPIVLPARLTGKISLEGRSESDAATQQATEDIDVYRFRARAGEPWLIEIQAADEKSELDSRLDLFDEHGEPVLRTRLQALRESYFTFRGKDSDTSDDFRLHKWEDMELDEYLYSNGEVTRLWLYPRGPDSGFKVYPGAGKRVTFFGTTPVSHPLGAPTYIVRELAPDEEAVPNGLPVFPVYFENDDDPERRAGKDSRLSFTAPSTGEFFLRVRDARSFGGDDFHYTLRIRRPQPDFSIALSTKKLSMPKGSGREWQVTATRIDGMSGPISIAIEGLPEGFVATNPLIIEAEQQTCLGTIFATEQAILPTSAPNAQADQADQADQAEAPASNPPPTVTLKLTARGLQDGQEIVHELEDQLELSLVDQTEVQFQLVAADDSQEELTELVIRPGQTVSAKVVVQRNGTTSRIGFGNEDSGRNLPHGAYVDNIGLNGLLITEQQNEREFVITAAAKVQPGRRQFHLRADTKGNPTSRPVWLTVLPRE